MPEIRRAESIALGITIDEDNQVVIAVSLIVNDDLGYGVAMTTDVARHFGRSARDLSREADTLQDELDDLDPEEIQDRLTAIRNRYLTGPPDPSETA